MAALFGEDLSAKFSLALACLLLLAINLYTIWATAAEYQTLGFAVP